MTPGTAVGRRRRTPLRQGGDGEKGGSKNDGRPWDYLGEPHGDNVPLYRILSGESDISV